MDNPARDTYEYDSDINPDEPAYLSRPDRIPAGEMARRPKT